MFDPLARLAGRVELPDCLDQSGQFRGRRIFAIIHCAGSDRDCRFRSRHAARDERLWRRSEPGRWRMGSFLTIGMAAMLAAATPGEVAVEDLGWMSGRWESVSGERWVEESWTAPRAGTMFGISRTGAGDSLR